jgi:fatty acid/phospholipid biosynthesis enzyme
VRGLVIKAHGSSNRDYIQNALRIACEALDHDLEARCQRDIAEVSRILKDPEAVASSSGGEA